METSFRCENKPGYWIIKIIIIIYPMAIITYMGEITVDLDLLINDKVCVLHRNSNGVGVFSLSSSF